MARDISKLKKRIEAMNRNGGGTTASRFASKAKGESEVDKFFRTGRLDTGKTGAAAKTDRREDESTTDYFTRRTSALAGNARDSFISDRDRQRPTASSPSPSPSPSRSTDEAYYDYVRRMRNSVAALNAPARTGAVFGTDIDTGNVKPAKNPLDSLPDIDSRYLDGVRQMLRQSEGAEAPKRNAFAQALADPTEVARSRVNYLENEYGLNKSFLSNTPTFEQIQPKRMERTDEELAVLADDLEAKGYVDAANEVRNNPDAYRYYEASETQQDYDMRNALEQRGKHLYSRAQKAREDLAWEEETDRWQAVDAEAKASGWQFTEDDYADYQTRMAELDVERSRNQAMNNPYGMPALMTPDYRGGFTIEEASTYEYLKSQGRDSDAAAYAAYIQPIVAQRTNTELAKEVANADPITQTALAIGLSPAKMMNAIDVGMQWVDRKITGSNMPIDVHSTGGYRVMADAGREAVTEKLNALGTFGDFVNNILGTEFQYDVPILNGLMGMTWGDIYGVGVDLGVATLNRLSFGNLSGAAMMLESSADSFADAQERGATNDEMFIYGTISGVAEGIGEALDFSTLKAGWADFGGGKAGWKFWTGVGIGAIEYTEGGAQEVLTEVITRWADKWVMGENSNFAMRVRALIAEGYTPQQAADIAQDEADSELFKTFIVGGLSQAVGFVGGAPFNIGRDARETGKRINALGNRDALQQMFSEATGSEVQMPKSNAGVGRTVNKQMRQLQQANDAERDAAVLDYYDRMKGTYIEGATEQEIADARKDSQQLKAVRDALLRSAQGRRVSGKQQQLLAVDDAAKATLEAYNKGDIKMSDAAVKRAETMEYAQAATVIPDIKNVRDTIEVGSTTEAVKQQASDVGAKMTRVEAAGSSVNGVSIQSIDGIKQVAKGNHDAILSVTMADGTQRDVKVDDVTFGNDVNTEVIEYAAVMKTPELAASFIEASKTASIGLDRLANGMNTAYDMGRAGFRNLSTVQKSTLTQRIDVNVVKAAYEMGVAARGKSVDGRIDKASQRVAKYLGREWRPGSIRYDASVDRGNLDKVQMQHIQQVEYIAKLMGINVELFATEADAKGRFTGENGSYNPNTNTIRLDINAGRNYAGDSTTETAMLRTMSHELTHAIQRNSPELYRKLVEAVVDVLGTDGKYDLEAAVDNKIAIAEEISKKRGIRYELNREQAIDEIVADACEMMLRDSDAVKRLADAHPDVAKTFAEKVMEFLDKLMEAVREIFGKERSDEAQVLARAFEGEIKNIRKLWSEALVQTAEASGRENAGMGNETAEDVMAAAAENPANEAAAGDAVGMYGEPARPKEAHIDQRVWAEMGDRKVDAFLNDYKYARIYMPTAASVLQSDLQNGIKGERFMTPDGEWNGQKRMTTQIIADALDDGMTWDGLQKALEIIVSAPNAVNEAGDPAAIRSNAAVKRVELMLDDMLSHGYKDSMGTVFAPDAEYIEYKNSLPGAIAEATPVAAEGSIQFSDVQFEMRDAVEYRRNLVAVHNRSESSLLMNIELGGFPMPSVAIVKADQGHSKFGEISVVLNRAAVDPLADKRNRVYGADAWTITFPRVRYEVDDRKFNALYSDLNALSRGIPDFLRSEMLSFTNIMYDGVSDLSAEEIFERARDNVAVQAAYLVDMHDGFEVQKKRVQNDPGFNEDRSDRYERFIKEYYGDISQIMKRPMNEIYEANKELFDSIMPLKIANPGRKRMFIANFVSQVDAYMKYDGPTYSEVADQEGTKRHITDKVDREGYARWLHKKLDGIIKGKGIRNNKDAYTSGGNRRSFKQLYDPYMLESIVKNMSRNSGRNAEGSRNWFAAAAREYGSVEEIRADSDRLKHVDAEAHAAQVDELNKRLDAATYAIADKAGNGLNRYTAAEQVQDIVAANAAKKNPAAAMLRELTAEGYKVNAADVAAVVDTLIEMRDMPTEYFEAKLGRAVGFDEVAAVIAPDNIDTKTRAAVEGAGMRLIEYAAGDEQARLDALNGLEDVKFSPRTSFSDQIDELLNGKFPKGDHLYMMETPEVLVKIGLPELPVLMTQQHVKSTMKTSGTDAKVNYHGLTKSGLKKLPKYIEKPVLIMRAATYSDRVIVVTEMQNDDNETVIVPVIMNAKGTWQNARIEANIVATAYGKKEIKNMVARAIVEDRMLYIDKKRSDAFAQNVGIQFPKRLRNGSFIKSIQQSAEFVNRTSSNEPTTESKKFSPRGIADATDVERMTLKQIDEGYMAAMRAGADEGQLMTYVDEIARRRGYLSGNFMHGTNDFGFTKFDPEFSKDKISLFVVEHEDVARSYAGEGARPRRLTDKPRYSKADIEAMGGKELADLYNQHNGTRMRPSTPEDVLEVMRNYIYDAGDAVIKRLKRAMANFEEGSSERQELQQLLDDVDRLWEAPVDTPQDFKGSAAFTSVDERVNSLYERKILKYNDKLAWDKMRIGAGEQAKHLAQYEWMTDDADLPQNGGELLSKGMLMDDMLAKESGGIYDLYIKYDPGTFFEVGGDEAINWNAIDGGLIGRPREDVTTRDVVAWAKEHGYAGVMFNRIRDSGGKAEIGGYEEGADIIAVFDGRDIKSADPITYDDAGNIIPPSERFDETQEDIRWSMRDPDAISDRELLANALESVAQNDEERTRLAAYKENLGKLNEVQQQLEAQKDIIRELMFKKGRSKEETQRLKQARNRAQILSEQVARADKSLLKLEAMTPIQNVLKREGDKVRAKMREMQKERIADIRERHENETLRKSIIKRAKRLDTLVRVGDRNVFVPDDLRDAIIDVVSLFTQDDTVFGKRENSQGVPRWQKLHDAYDAMRKTTDDIAAMYDESIASKLNELHEALDSRNIRPLTDKNPIGGLSGEQLKNVRDILMHFQKLIADGNKIFRNGRAYAIDELSGRFVEETSGKKYGMNRLNQSGAAAWLRDGMATPVYFFRRLGGVFGELGNDIIRAESKYGLLASEYHDRVQGILKKYNHKDWADKKGDTLDLETESGANIELTREQAMAVYATYERQRRDTTKNSHHLDAGGITLKLDPKKLGIFKKTTLENENVQLTSADIGQITGWLTDEQKAYVGEMVQLMSKDLAELGNIVSRQLHGYSKFGEEWYFPYVTDRSFFNTKLGEADEVAFIKNMSHAKSTVENATAPIEVTDFTRTAVTHINNMLMYSTFAVPQDNFMRVFDHHIEGKNTIKKRMEQAYGRQTTKYIKQLMKDMYGGVTTNEPLSGIIGRSRKAKVMMSASVVVQQPSSLVRAFAVINPKYFANHLPRTGGWQEAQKYAGTAVIKSIGGFDAGNSKNIVDWIMQEKWADGVMEGIDNVGSWLPSKADAMTWGTIWQAVKQEQADKTGLDIHSEELKKIAGERFDEVIRLTQVYDSTLSRSQLMRSKSAFTKQLTAFMGEPTLTYNMAYDAIKNPHISKGARAATGIALVGNLFLNSALKSIITAMRDDDDDEATYWERYIKAFAGDFTSGLMPWNYVPVAKDAWSIALGYDITRADTEVMQNLNTLIEVFSKDDVDPWKAVKATASLLSSATGIPFANAYRDGMAVWNTIQTSRRGNEWRKGAGKNAVLSGVVNQIPYYNAFAKSPSERMYEAAAEGDAAETERWSEYMTIYKDKDDKDIGSAFRAEVKDAYLDGEIDDEKALDLVTEYGNTTTKEPEKYVKEWEFQRDFGFSYSGMKDAYLDGEISKEEAIEARQHYGGVKRETAERTVNGWDAEKESDN